MHNFRIHSSDQGFTLVELAIALMVIGLLIGGVLKGQELIENARITATIRQIKAYDAAAMIFRNTYNALPGDIKRPNRIPNCTEELCNIGGNGNGRFDWDEIEIFNFFPHLTKAGMIQGPVGGTSEEYDQLTGHKAFSDEYTELFFPNLPIDLERAFYPIYSNNISYTDFYMSAGLYYYFSLIQAKHLSALDDKLDDGKANSGDIVFADSVCSMSHEGNPDLYNPIEVCDAYIRAGF